MGRGTGSRPVTPTGACTCPVHRDPVSGVLQAARCVVAARKHGPGRGEGAGDGADRALSESTDPIERYREAERTAASLKQAFRRINQWLVWRGICTGSVGAAGGTFAPCGRFEGVVCVGCFCLLLLLSVW
jgi:hypothetical protein